MSILASRFWEQGAHEGTQEFNALEKAITESPQVLFIGASDLYRYFEVTSIGKAGARYVVRIREDEDRHVEERGGELYTSERGQFWIDCYCKGATPPIDAATGVMAWHEKVCYHIAAVLIYDSAECTTEEPEIPDDVLPLES